jgi:hypothetical protein
MALLAAEWTYSETDNDETINLLAEAIDKKLASGGNIGADDMNGRVSSLLLFMIERDISGAQQSTIEARLATGKVQVAVKTWDS